MALWLKAEEIYGDIFDAEDNYLLNLQLLLINYYYFFFNSGFIDSIYITSLFLISLLFNSSNLIFIIIAFGFTIFLV